MLPSRREIRRDGTSVRGSDTVCAGLHAIDTRDSVTNMVNRRQIALAAGALSLAALATFDPPSANVQILTHDSRDAAPARFQAAVDLGLASASILVTWTAERLVR